MLATVATIIASQSIITGAFSMTRQAIQLGWLPRLRITQTSEKGYGQIYVGVVNWLLMVVTVGLTLFFGKSDNLAAAYGIAVSATMLMTSALLFIAMREVWEWSLLTSGAVAGAFLCVDASFFLANLAKIADGGYVPLLLASLVYGLMWVWHRGTTAVAEVLSARAIPVSEFMSSLEASRDSAGSWHGGFPHSNGNGHAASRGLACQAQQGLARTFVCSQGRDGIRSMDQGVRTLIDD